jgi:hypothetical protein
MRTFELRETEAAIEAPLDEYSLSPVLGGPLYQLYLRTRLARSPIELVWRRILILSAICWLPLLILAFLNGRTVGGSYMSLLSDTSVHIDFLFALPLLIGAEVVVHRGIPALILQFLDRGIIAPEDRGRFQGLIEAGLRLRNSVMVEICMVLAVFALSYWLWTPSPARGITGWYGSLADGRAGLTAAGYWYEFVSLPILRFLLLRWYFRLFLWYGFLWRVRTLPMHLNLFHPDRAAGLGFLSGSMFAFAPILAAQTMILAGMIGNRIWHAGAKLPNFKMEIAGAVLFLILTVVAPLTFFTLKLMFASRVAKRELGLLSSRYVDGFRRKCIKDSNGQYRSLLGSPDIQSLADLRSVFDTVSNMRLLPFSARTVARLAIIVSAPLAPLTLTMVPLGSMLDGIIKLLL